MQGCGKLDPTDIVFSDLILATCLWGWSGIFIRGNSVRLSHQNDLVSGYLSGTSIPFFLSFSFFNWMFLKHYHFYALVTELFSGEWCSYSIFFPCVCLVGLWVVSSNQEGLIILKSHQRQSTRKILWLDSFA